MTKLFKVFLINLAVLLSFNAYSQCSVTATSSETNLICGQCADLNAIGIQGSFVMNNDFNTGVAGPGWSATSAADFSNPCGPGPGGSYMWMGSTSAAPRTLTTNNFDMSCGGQVCFDFRMAEQGGASPCEGPDLTTEGVYFQYSTNGGVTWTTINYFDPMGGYDPVMTTWNNYCFTLPAGAWTTNTMFQWAQTATSSSLNDHWGIDNVTILANDCGYYYDWAHIPGSPDSSYGGSVCPTSTTTYNVIYTNGINDTCSSSVTVNILFPDVNVSATVNPITTCGGCTQLDGTLTSIPPDSCCYTLDMDDSFGDGWNGGFLMVNPTVGPALGPFSAAGSGSVITFCVPDGTTFTLNYTSGSWENENTYTLYDPSMTAIFNDGPTPSTGSVFTTTASCGTAPPVYVWNWTGSSLTAINDSTQTACPTSAGWYYVTVSASGCSSTDSIYIDYTPTPVTSTQNVSVCNGVVYTFPDGSTQTITGSVTQTSTLVGAAINGCDSVVTTNVSLLPNATSTVNASVCVGSVYTFPDGSTQTIVAPTTQTSTLVGAAVNGCDSIVTTNVSISTSVTSTQNVSVCNGVVYTFPDGSTQTITGSVTQVSTLVGASTAGCDSIVTTNVSLLPNLTSTINTNICNGDNYTFPDGTVMTGITTPTTHISNLTTTLGCDSIITTNLTIDPVYNLTENVSVCDGDSYTFPDGTIIPTIVAPVTYISNLTTTNGCDSIITTNVSVNPVYSQIQNVTVCDGSSYTFPDGFVQTGITSPMTHVSILTTVNGCDSIITTSVGVFPAYTSTTNASVCDGDSYTFADGTVWIITIPTTYVSTLTSIDGCDSLVTENISVNPVFNIIENYDQCPGLNFTFPDGSVMTNINNDVTYVSNLTTTNGCDSIITTNLNVYDIPPFDISFSPNGCPDLSMTMVNNTPGSTCDWVINGPGTYSSYIGCGPIVNTFYNSGLYDVTLTMTSPDGCPMDTTIFGAFEVYPVPLASFTWNPNEGTVVTNNTITFTNNSIGGTSFEWSFGDGTTSNVYSYVHSYSDSGSYNIQLIVTNNYGCVDTAQGIVLIHDEFFIFVPNTFTPDGDPHNNTFLPIISGHDPYNYELLIFNRWGELIFESHNSNVGWDGTYSGALVQDGTYVWKINVKTNRNLRREYIGHVNVLK